MANNKKTILMRVPVKFRDAIYNKKINMENDLQKITHRKFSIPMTNILLNLSEARTKELNPHELRELTRRKKW